MTSKTRSAVAGVAVSLVVGVTIALAAQDKYTLKAPNGIEFSEFRGYESWEDVAVSVTEDGIKAILGNHEMIKAYKAGVPGNGKPFPDGCKVVKIEWTKKKNEKSRYFVEVPEKLKSVAFIVKDAKRFPDSSGWGFAEFTYDAPSDTFAPFGKDRSFAATCYECHTDVKERDYIFTAYPKR